MNRTTSSAQASLDKPRPSLNSSSPAPERAKQEKSYAGAVLSALIIGCAFTPFTAVAESRPATFCNPIDLPYRFQEPDGTYRSAADPAVVLFQNAYWLFASRCGGYWRSEDLNRWTFVAASGYPLDIWAPTVVEAKGKLYLTTGDKSGTYTTDDPASGKWVHVSAFARVLEDPMTLQDDDGRVYLYDGCSNVNPLRVTELDPKTFTPISTVVETVHADTANHGWEVPGDANEDFAAKPWIEGSWVNKLNGRYYLQYSGPGTQFKTYGDGVYVADKPTGPFVYAPYSPFSFKPTGFITAAGHSTTFADKQGLFWHATSQSISKRHMFERRLGLYPTGALADGQLVTNTYLGDYPQFIPGVTKTPLQDNSPHWMLVSYARPVKASSTLPPRGNESFDPPHAVDENIRTWWSAATGNAGEWLEVDLTKPCRIDAVQINFADEGAKAGPEAWQGVREERPVAATSDAARPQASPNPPNAMRYPEYTYRYVLEASEDGQRWSILADHRTRGRDAPNEYIQLEQPFRARYLRLTNVAMPAGGKFSVSGLRAFGSGQGTPPPEVKTFNVKRDPRDPRHATVSWPAPINTDFVIVRYGIAPDRLFTSYQVYGATSVDLRALNVGTSYFFAVDAVNDTAVTRGIQVEHD